MEVAYKAVGVSKSKICRHVSGLACMLSGGIQTQFLMLAQGSTLLTGPASQSPQVGFLHFFR